VRHKLEAANASLQSTAADLENARLVLSAELAADYFSLRELDAELQVVEENVGYERKGLELVNNRHDGGIASGLEVAQQSALLDATLTQLALVRQSRAQYEHAIAVLVGQSASNFEVAAAPLHAAPPPLPLGVPADVLERRPDIASMERQIAYANAQVGVAHAACTPTSRLAAPAACRAAILPTCSAHPVSSGLSAQMPCSPSSRAVATAPIWPPRVPPITSPWPTTPVGADRLPAG